jgi:transcriptional regulator of heat shock response
MLLFKLILDNDTSLILPRLPKSSSPISDDRPFEELINLSLLKLECNDEITKNKFIEFFNNLGFRTDEVPLSEAKIEEKRILLEKVNKVYSILINKSTINILFNLKNKKYIIRNFWSDFKSYQKEQINYDNRLCNNKLEIKEIKEIKEKEIQEIKEIKEKKYVKQNRLQKSHNNLIDIIQYTRIDAIKYENRNDVIIFGSDSRAGKFRKLGINIKEGIYYSSKDLIKKLSVIIFENKDSSKTSTSILISKLPQDMFIINERIKKIIIVDSPYKEAGTNIPQYGGNKKSLNDILISILD